MRFGPGILIVCVTLAVTLLCCKKKESVEPSAPIVQTVGLAAITDSSVKAGGRITSSGAQDITATGFCWSTLTTDPTIIDDTTVTGSISPTFVTELFNLDPSTTYYIRAYAINSLGVGYGEVVSFNTSNSVPKIDSITVTGFVAKDSTLTATYFYSDFESNPDSATSYQWYNSIDTTGTTDMPISGANASAYTITLSDTLKYIRVGVTPFSSVGASPGRELRSTWIGPIPNQ